MKVECKQHRERFSEYLDGKMAEADRNALEAHVARCAACRRELDLLRRTIRAVAALPERSAPAGFRQRVARSIAAESAPAGGRRPTVLWARVLPVAAMLALVLGLLVSVPGRKSAERPTAVRRLAMARRAAEPEAPAAMPIGGREAMAGARPVATEEAQQSDRLRMMPGAVSGVAERLARTAGVPAGPPHAPVRLGEAEAIRGVAAAGARDESDLLKPPAFSWNEVGMPEDVRRLLEGGQPFVFTQIPSSDLAPPARHAQQVFTVMADEPIEMMRQTVAAANGIGVRADLRVEPEDKDNGGVDVFLTVPAARYEGLLKELAKLAPPERQSLANTDAASGQFFDAMLANYAFYKRARKDEEKSEEAKTTAEGALGAPTAFGAVAGRAPETAAAAKGARERAGGRFYWRAGATRSSSVAAEPVRLVIRIQRPVRPPEGQP